MRPDNGTWSGAFPAPDRPGEYVGHLRLADEYHGWTVVPFTYVVPGREIVAFERTIETRAGAFADVIALWLPTLHHATIEICNGSCDPIASSTPTCASVVCVRAPEGHAAIALRQGATVRCAAVHVDARCSAAVLGGAMDLSWTQAANTTATVRIRGTVVG